MTLLNLTHYNFQVLLSPVVNLFYILILVVFTFSLLFLIIFSNVDESKQVERSEGDILFDRFKAFKEHPIKIKVDLEQAEAKAKKEQGEGQSGGSKRPDNSKK